MSAAACDNDLFFDGHVLLNNKASKVVSNSVSLHVKRYISNSSSSIPHRQMHSLFILLPNNRLLNPESRSLRATSS